jgi:pyruvate formate lyase activating enzyme
MIGKEMSAAEVVAAVTRDAAFYGGRGGLTLTGGEPTFQPAFAEAILRLARVEGLHTAIETCGACTWAALEGLLPWLDLVLFDLKHMNPEIHRKFTGGDNLANLENLRRTTNSGVEVVVRVPLVPGFNTDANSLAAMAGFIRSLESVSAVHLLPYHTLGRAKYRALEIDYIMKETPR